MSMEWHYFNDECLHCGSIAEVYTQSDKDNYAYDGEEARCPDCGLYGYVVVDDLDSGAYINWHDEPGCDCTWCQKHFPEDFEE